MKKVLLITLLVLSFSNGQNEAATDVDVMASYCTSFYNAYGSLLGLLDTTGLSDTSINNYRTALKDWSTKTQRLKIFLSVRFQKIDDVVPILLAQKRFREDSASQSQCVHICNDAFNACENACRDTRFAVTPKNMKDLQKKENTYETCTGKCGLSRDSICIKSSCKDERERYKKCSDLSFLPFPY